MRRTRGLLASMRKAFLALAMVRKGKVQIVPRSASGMDEIRKLFDVVEKNK
jgi:hypothetical protein